MLLRWISVLSKFRQSLIVHTILTFPVLQECLDDCKAAKLIAIVAERLKRELDFTIEDIIWGGGDIDPLPFEKAVRERFSHPLDK